MDRKTNPTEEETLFNLAYSEKKVTKTHIRSININLIIQNTDVDKLNLKKLSIILIALSKVYHRRIRALLEDSNHLFQILNRSTAKKVPRASSSKNITLNIENNKLIINDEMIDFGEETIVEKLEQSLMEQSFMDPAFEVDFGDAPSIEQVRDSTGMGSVLFNNTEISINVKRRKLVEDKSIEITENIFKSNLRTVHDILMKPKTNAIDLGESLVTVDKKILSFLESLKQQSPVVEEHRNQEFDVDFQAPDFSFNPISTSKDNDFEWNSSSLNIFNDFDSLPKNFSFNLLTQQLSREERVNSFFSLLSLATENKIKVVQEDAFSSIECTLNE